MHLGLEPIATRREPLATEIARRILDYLLAGNVERGERIPSERKLAAALGVGRSVVREALKSLTLLGLIEVRPGDGTYLRRLDSDLLPQAIEWGLLLGEKRFEDLVEARHYLEVVVAGLAAVRRSADDVVALRAYLGQMQSACNTDAFVAADLAFHLRVAEAAGNLSLLQIMTSIRNLLAVWMKRVWAADVDVVRSCAEHEQVLLAIDASDPDRARRAMETHMESATDRLHGTLEADGHQPGAPSVI